MSTKPIHDKHAIYEVAFALDFGENFSAETVADLMRLHDAVRPELPYMEERRRMSMTLSVMAGQQSTQETVVDPSPAGVVFRAVASPDPSPWMLRAENNRIIVNCLEYTRWEEIWGRTKGYLQLTLDVVARQPSMQVNAVVLQYIDRFVRDNTDGYSAGEVFNQNSSFLTKQIFRSSELWHLHHGHFDMLEKYGKTLDVLNIGTLVDISGHTTTIDHMQQLVLQDAPLAVTDVLGKIDDIMCRLHTRNKQILLDLLNTQMLDRINLRPESATEQCK